MTAFEWMALGALLNIESSVTLAVGLSLADRVQLSTDAARRRRNAQVRALVTDAVALGMSMIGLGRFAGWW